MVSVAMKETAKQKRPTKIMVTPKKTPGQNYPGAVRLHRSTALHAVKCEA